MSLLLDSTGQILLFK